MQAMPTIIVMTTSTTEDNSAITLQEDVKPAHLTSEHHAAQLIERIGWAVTDAEIGEAKSAKRRSSAVAL
jgi:hypothetical protein